MKNFAKISARNALLSAALAVPSIAMAVDVGYSSAPTALIQFNGNGTFDFTPSADNFQITTGTATGITGEIGGTFTIGAISGNVASVSGTGTLQIDDPTGVFKATLAWVDIGTFGTGNVLDTQGQVALTGITYSGTNPNLTALAQGPDTDVLNFQFNTPQTVQQLKTTVEGATFAGDISTTTTSTVPDGGATIAFMGGALLVLGGIRRKLGC